MNQLRILLQRIAHSMSASSCQAFQRNAKYHRVPWISSMIEKQTPMILISLTQIQIWSKEFKQEKVTHSSCFTDIKIFTLSSCLLEQRQSKLLKTMLRDKTISTLQHQLVGSIIQIIKTWLWDTIETGLKSMSCIYKHR